MGFQTPYRSSQMQLPSPTTLLAAAVRCDPRWVMRPTVPLVQPSNINCQHCNRLILLCWRGHGIKPWMMAAASEIKKYLKSVFMYCLGAKFILCHIHVYMILPSTVTWSLTLGIRFWPADMLRTTENNHFLFASNAIKHWLILYFFRYCPLFRLFLFKRHLL